MTRTSLGWADYQTGVTPPRKKATVAPTDEPSLFAPVVPAARLSDPATSNDGIHDVLPRAGSQQYRLLLAYASRPMGLTNEEAAEIAGLFRPGVCYWKRSSELLKAGLIADTFAERTASTGSAERVCAITKKGQAAIRSGTGDGVRVAPERSTSGIPPEGSGDCAPLTLPDDSPSPTRTP